MLEFIGTITAIAMLVSVGWVLVNNILMPFIWEVVSTTMKSVLKALISKINNRKEEGKNNM